MIIRTASATRSSPGYMLGWGGMLSVPELGVV